MYYRTGTAAAQSPLLKEDIAAHNQRQALLLRWVLCVSKDPATHFSGLRHRVDIKDGGISTCMEDDKVNLSGPGTFRGCR